MKKFFRRKKPESGFKYEVFRTWDDKLLDFLYKAIIPVAILWGITGIIWTLVFFGVIH